jgi:probable rRNA maturation factor
MAHPVRKIICRSKTKIPPTALVISIKNLQKKIPLNRQRIKKIIFKTLSLVGRGKTGEINVLVTGDQRIKNLNKKYLHQPRPTDVLVFELSGPQDKSGIFADIIISAHTAMRNAKIYKTLPQDELCLYLAHGLLHLVGYDDQTARQRGIMNEKAAGIIREIG